MQVAHAWNSVDSAAVQSGVRSRVFCFPWLIRAAVAIFGGPVAVQAQSAASSWTADFDDGWKERWVETRLDARFNRFNVVEDEGRRVLQVESDNSASALWHPLDQEPSAGSRVAWRWRLEATLTGNRSEREKRGDDFAARFFVIFDGQPFSRGARAICYVWAASEPVGSRYRNPYFPNVLTIVLRSGDELAGEWVSEERDFMADYREAFGELPSSVTAVAVMADTDNTGRRATSWFADIRLVSRD